MSLRLTDEAVEHLAGRPLVLRPSHRNGCCGGAAELPVAEPGPPVDPSAYRRLRAGAVEVHVDPHLGPVDSWVVDVDGLWRWRRLRVEAGG